MLDRRRLLTIAPLAAVGAMLPKPAEAHTPKWCRDLKAQYDALKVEYDTVCAAHTESVRRVSEHLATYHPESTVEWNGDPTVPLALFYDSSTSPAYATHTLLRSENADGSNATPLSGATVSGTEYIFVSPTTDVVSVEFFIDGTFERTENAAPFSLKGDDGTLMHPLDTTLLTNATHTVSANVTLPDNTIEALEASFTVQNDVGGYQVVYSTANDGSNLRSLHGAVVSGSVYVEVSPTSDIASVKFFVNEYIVNTETAAPYTLMGETNGNRNPWDTTNGALLAGHHYGWDGWHLITAEITTTGGSVVHADAWCEVHNCAADWPLRTVSVTTPAGLTSAINNSRAGDDIVMEDGSAALTIYAKDNVYEFRTDQGAQSGTPQYPIRLRSRSGNPLNCTIASINSDDSGDGTTPFALLNVRYWMLEGFTIDRGYETFIFHYNRNCIVRNVHAKRSGGPCVVVQTDSIANGFEDMTVFDTGYKDPGRGEGMYVGTDGSGIGYFMSVYGLTEDNTRDNLFRRMNIYDTTADCYENKDTSKRNMLLDSTVDGSSIVVVDDFRNPVGTKAIDPVIRRVTVNGATQHGIHKYNSTKGNAYSSGGEFVDNIVNAASGGASGYGIKADSNSVKNPKVTTNNDINGTFALGAISGNQSDAVTTTPLPGYRPRTRP